MRILIPMAGVGERFVTKGFNLPKPLIKVGDKSMIEKALEMFPGRNEYTFIINKSHRNYNLKQFLLMLKPGSLVVEIEYQKRGPVWGFIEAAQIEDQLVKDNGPVLVSYCDFGVKWDFEDFKATVRKSGCDGCVISYSGFHPHLVDQSRRYAGMVVSKKGRLVQIREKHSFTSDLTHGYHSAGSYYFKSGALLKKYVFKTINSVAKINGENYFSQVYQPMIKDKLNVINYTVKYFIQWGTPEDLHLYTYWRGYFYNHISGNID